MSVNRTSSWRRSSALLPWLLWALLLPSPIVLTTGFDPTAGPSLAANSPLLFDSSAPGNSLRNCSCPAPIRDCDEALANLLCSCRTVPRSSLPPAGLTEPGGLAVWVREPWVFQELLNGSTVAHLRLAFCGSKSLPSQYLALFGLKTLEVHSAAPGSPHPDQVLSLEATYGAAGGVGGGFLSSDTGTLSSSPSVLHVAFLDIGLLNGFSTLKAYSIVEPSLWPHFSHLPVPLHSDPPQAEPMDPSDGPSKLRQGYLLTIIY
ncbi:exosomal polycystin-1-interacting protein-like [Aplochiton taeniatus]